MLTHTNFNAIIISTNKKAVAPTKSKPPPINKKGKPIISHSAKRYKDMKEAIKKLESKGYFVCNQFDGFTSTIAGEYELYKGENVVIDHLSEAQVIQLSNIL